MCEVCAVFGIGDHWTDAASLASPTFPAADIQRFRAERKRRLALVNALIAPAGARCADWDGESLVLTDNKGRMEVIPDLAVLWARLERLTGARLDPLSPGVPA